MLSETDLCHTGTDTDCNTNFNPGTNSMILFHPASVGVWCGKSGSFESDQ